MIFVYLVLRCTPCVYIGFLTQVSNVQLSFSKRPSHLELYNSI